MFDIPAGADQFCEILIPFILIQNEDGIHRTADAGGTGQSVDGISIALLPQMVYQQFRDAAERKNDEDVIRTLTALKEGFLKLPFYNTYMKTLGWIDMYLAAPEHIDTIYEDIDKLSFFYHAAEDIPLIQKQYAWFIDSALDDGGQRRKKCQRKLPPAERILMNLMDVYVSGRSLGSDRNVNAPNVQMQYAVFQTENGAEIVEKMYFDRILDFVYVELMKGLQKGFLPKRCPNCGRWFAQEPGMDFNYCANPAPQDPTKLCREEAPLQT